MGIFSPKAIKTRTGAPLLARYRIEKMRCLGPGGYTRRIDVPAFYLCLGSVPLTPIAVYTLD